MTAAPLEELDFRRLLVAIDGSPGSELTLRVALTAARRQHAALTLITVAPPISGWGGQGVAVQPEIDDGMERVLRDAAARLPDDVPVKTLWRRGRPGPEIVAEAQTGAYDAIILGARGVGKLAGSVSQHVLHHAPVAVMVAHPGPDRAPRARS